MERVEAIKILRELHDKAPFSVRTALETLIPELKESRDEQIRKAMLQHFKNKTKENWCNIPVKDIISWLEKQKDHFRDDTKMVEQKPAEWSKDDEDMLESIIGDYDYLCKIWLPDYEKRVGATDFGARRDNREQIAWLKLLHERFNLMPKQPVEGLEEEITRYLREECSSDNEPSVSEIARHFAEWGAEHARKEDK